MRLTAAGLAALALALAGCGSDQGSTTTSGDTALAISLDADGPGGKPARTAHVACDGAAREAACALVDQLSASDGDPVPAGTACTEIYGGPDVARIDGTIRGEPIHARLTRADGCEIDPFDRFTPLLRELFAGYRPGQALRG